MKMNTVKNYLLGVALGVSVVACSEDNNTPGGNSGVTGPYVVCLGVTSSSATSYYVVPVDGFMDGTISAANNKGLEQNGYRSFQVGNNTLFSVGGLGLTDANLITKAPDGTLQQHSSFTFQKSLFGLEQADSENMIAVDMATSPTGGDDFNLYQLDIQSGAIVKKVSRSLKEWGNFGDMNQNWPQLTGMAVSGDKVYMTFYLTDETQKPGVTTKIDKIYVAVYSYPELEYLGTMEDERAAVAGSWNGFNGIFKTESGDLYTFSNTSIANGFSQNSEKKAAFLRIPGGTSEFDETYYFDVETAAGGFKPVHLQYLGKGKFFAEITTLKSEEMSRWTDEKLKAAIIDINEKKVSYIDEIPVHDGDGAQRMSGIVEGDFFYFQIPVNGALYFYRIDINNATAERGAKVESNFVSGSFKIG